MKKLAIIGASYLQLPLIKKAKEMKLETHVFAWAANDLGEKEADYFYPISIIEKEKILKKCQEISIDGICTIASDLAVITVNYVASVMNLPGNSMECTELSTNKYLMRQAFFLNHDPSPKSLLAAGIDDLKDISLDYPVIVKPIDRSGSRGITKLESSEGLKEAIEDAKKQGFDKHVLIEEYVSGQEYSIECISNNGKHHFLAATKKYTTGTPHFIETGHLEPAPLSDELLEKIKNSVFHALDSLKIKNGASHSELKISDTGDIKIIEIGGRMGGDFIGSTLVASSTGIDFVRGVIDIALGHPIDLKPMYTGCPTGIRFIFTDQDLKVLEELKKDDHIVLVDSEVHIIKEGTVTDSSTRFGYYIFKAKRIEDLEKYLPKGE